MEWRKIDASRNQGIWGTQELEQIREDFSVASVAATGSNSRLQGYWKTYLYSFKASSLWPFVPEVILEALVASCQGFRRKVLGSWLSAGSWLSHCVLFYFSFLFKISAFSLNSDLEFCAHNILQKNNEKEMKKGHSKIVMISQESTSPTKKFLNGLMDINRSVFLTDYVIYTWHYLF